MAIPTANAIPLSGDARIDGLVQGSAWAFGGGARTLNYSLNINDTVDGVGNALGGTWAQYPALADAVARAFAEWSKFANIAFVSTGVGGIYYDSAAELAVTLTGDDLQTNFDGAASLGFFPDPAFGDVIRAAAQEEEFSYPRPEGDIFIDNYLDAFSGVNVAAGGLGFTYILHEIGHALGLKHTNDDGGNARPTYAALGIGAQDTRFNTLMGAAAIAGSGSSSTGNAASPMPFDVLAIQRVYGANATYANGDDTYALADDGILRTLWDGGGTDTLSAAGLDVFGGVQIDLRAGALSTHGVFSRTAIAFNVVIENAIGSHLSDTIHGNDAANRLDGGAGESALLSPDTLIGHAGDDVYVVDLAADIVTESVGEGLDTVISSATLALPAHVENLVLSGIDAIDGSGNSADNRITGNSNANRLEGGVGNDVLDGGLGADVLDGGDGDDHYVVGDTDTLIDSGGIDTVESYIPWTLGAAFEHLTLLGAASYGIGNDLANLIQGNAAPNPLLRGAGGADTILGGDGDDWLEGETGNDPFAGVAGNDYLQGDAGNDTVLAGDGDDVIHGNSGVDVLVGEGGNDLMFGDEDTDYVDGRSGNDVLYGNAGADVLFGDQGQDSLYGGEGNDILMGERGDVNPVGALDVIYGEAGGDLLNGGGGDDWIFGGEGNDVIDGRDGSDLVYGGPAADIMQGSAASEFNPETPGGDLFVYTQMTDAGDAIYGFDTRAGTNDGIDLRPLFDALGYAGATARTDGYMRFLLTGSATAVQIDPDGPAAGFAAATLVTLIGVDLTDTGGLPAPDAYFLFQ